MLIREHLDLRKRNLTVSANVRTRKFLVDGVEDGDMRSKLRVSFSANDTVPIPDSLSRFSYPKARREYCHPDARRKQWNDDPDRNVLGQRPGVSELEADYWSSLLKYRQYLPK